MRKYFIVSQLHSCVNVLLLSSKHYGSIDPENKVGENVLPFSNFEYEFYLHFVFEELQKQHHFFL